MKNILHAKAHEKPHNAKAFFGMYKNLLAFSGDDILADVSQHDVESEAFKIGMKAFYNENMI